MIKWYYKLKRILMPIIILIIAACFIIIPLVIFYEQKSGEKEITIEKPEISYKVKPHEVNRIEEDIPSAGKLATSDWLWTYDLSQLDGFTINDYFVFAYKKSAKKYDEHVDSSGQRTYWSKKPIDGDWTDSLLWDALYIQEDDLTDETLAQYNNDLSANVSEWKNDGTQFVSGVTSADQGYSLSARVSVTKINDNGVPITFDNVYLGGDILKTKADDYTKYISTPYIPWINLDSGHIGGIFENNKNLFVNPYEFTIWPRVPLDVGLNEDLPNEIYEIVPHLKADIYYDNNYDPYTLNGDEKYKPEEDFLITSIDTDQQIVNGEYMFQKGKQAMYNELYDDTATLVDVDLNSFKVDIEYNYKFKGLEELKTILDVDYVLPEGGQESDFDYITDLNNPEEYTFTANNLTIDHMEDPIDAMSAKIIPESLSTVITTNDLGYTQISLATRDDYIFNSKVITTKDYSIETNFKYFSDLQGPEVMFGKWLSFTTFNKDEIDDGDFMYSSTDVIPKMFPKTSEYFIDPTSSFVIERDGNSTGTSSDWTIAYGLQELKYFFDKDSVELINYDTVDEIPDLIPQKGESGFNLIAPSNVHYRNIEHDYNSSLMYLIIILLILVLIIPIIISISIVLIRNRKTIK